MILNHFEQVYAITNDDAILISEHYRERGYVDNLDTYRCGGLDFTHYIEDGDDEFLLEHFPEWVFLNLEDCDSFFEDEQSKNIKDAFRICKIDPSEVNKFLYLSIVNNRKMEKIRVFAYIIDEKGTHIVRAPYFGYPEDDQILLMREVYSDFIHTAGAEGIFKYTSKNTEEDLEMTFEEINEINI